MLFWNQNTASFELTRCYACFVLLKQNIFAHKYLRLTYLVAVESHKIKIDAGREIFHVALSSKSVDSVESWDVGWTRLVLSTYLCMHIHTSTHTLTHSHKVGPKTQLKIGGMFSLHLQQLHNCKRQPLYNTTPWLFILWSSLEHTIAYCKKTRKQSEIKISVLVDSCGTQIWMVIVKNVVAISSTGNFPVSPSGIPTYVYSVLLGLEWLLLLVLRLHAKNKNCSCSL